MKIKDLTLEQFHMICSSNTDCEKCPLHASNIKGIDTTYYGCVVRCVSYYFEEKYWNYEIRRINIPSPSQDLSTE